MVSATEPGGRPLIAVIGAGPAGLMAAETAAEAGCRVLVIDQMAAPGRKLLMAGRGGLNLTHSEPLEKFLGRYGQAESRLAPLIAALDPQALMAWAQGLGQQTFVGSSGRVFPKAMKASPLLRAWLARLGGLGVELRLRARFCGFDPDGRPLLSAAGGGTEPIPADAVVLALGGASWPRLGSDGNWVATLQSRGIAVTPLTAFNAGVLIAWSAHLSDRHAGEPLKRIAIRAGPLKIRGEAVITRHGLEGGVVYAANRAILDLIAAEGGAGAEIRVDLRPDLTAEQLTAELSLPRGSQSMSAFLKRRAGLSATAIAVLREPGGGRLPQSPSELASLIKSVPLTVNGTAGLDRAISTRGGVKWPEIDDRLMLKTIPGVFVAGEMIDWDAPTGGYLLQAVMATGAEAGRQAARWGAERSQGGTAHVAPTELL